jgi:hypothetical protein
VEFQEKFDNIVNDPNVPDADDSFTPDVLGHPRLANVWCHVRLQDRSKGRNRNGFSGKQQCLEQETVAFQSKDQGSEL